MLKFVGDDHLSSEIIFEGVCATNLKYSTRLKNRTRACFQVSVYAIVGVVWCESCDWGTNNKNIVVWLEGLCGHPESEK